MIFGQHNQQQLSVNSVWAKTVQVGEILYLIGAALVLLHFFTLIGALVGTIGKLYPVPLWIWIEFRVTVYLLAPLMWFRMLCTLGTHKLKFSQKENYAWVIAGSIIAFVFALQSVPSYSYPSFPLLCIAYAIQFVLDSRLPPPKPRKQTTPLSSHAPVSTRKKSTPLPFLVEPLCRPSWPLYVGIWHSAADARFAEQLRIHLQIKIRQGQIKLWDSDHIQPGAYWQEERARAASSTAVTVVLVSANLMAHDFAHTELPLILARAKAGGTVVLLLHVSTCDFSGNGLEIFQPINSSKRPLAQLGRADRDKIFTLAVTTICQRIKP